MTTVAMLSLAVLLLTIAVAILKAYAHRTRKELLCLAKLHDAFVTHVHRGVKDFSEQFDTLMDRIGHDMDSVEARLKKLEPSEDKECSEKPSSKTE